MSVWKDLREKSIGKSIRKEQIPPIDPDAERKKQEDTARWYHQQEEKRRRKKETTKMINICSGIGAVIGGLALVFSGFASGDMSNVIFTPLISWVVFIISRFILADIYYSEIEEW